MNTKPTRNAGKEEGSLPDDYSNLTVPLFSCLDPERAGSLYAGILALHFEEGMGLDLGDSEVTCLQVWAT